MRHRLDLRYRAGPVVSEGTPGLPAEANVVAGIGEKVLGIVTLLFHDTCKSPILGGMVIEVQSPAPDSPIVDQQEADAIRVDESA